MAIWPAGMRHTFAQALGACRRLEEEPELGAPKFRGNEAVLTFNDRLRAPNTPRALAAVRPGLDAALSQLYGGAAFTVEPNSDPRERLTLHIPSRGRVRRSFIAAESGSLRRSGP